MDSKQEIFEKLVAIENGVTNFADFVEFCDFIGHPNLARFYANYANGFYECVYIDDVETAVMTKKGEIELLVLKDEHDDRIVKGKIAFWRSQRIVKSLQDELTQKKAELQELSLSNDRRLEDARNLIWGYEQMADELNNIKITAQTMNRNIGIYRDDYDSLFIVWSLLCASIEHTSTNPNDYNELPF